MIKSKYFLILTVLIVFLMIGTVSAAEDNLYLNASADSGEIFAASSSTGGG